MASLLTFIHCLFRGFYIDRGFLACGYVSIDTCNRLNEACAIVAGVSDYEEVLHKHVTAVSNAAMHMGIKVGMKGNDALALLRAPALPGGPDQKGTPNSSECHRTRSKL
mmetsp:Transcript_34360/g.107751  ORF Transcript_34360/g.107751 Transcript_34360/m.107751 type:complete len:109 (-) Transcript_34360:446-772(-)